MSAQPPFWQNSIDATNLVIRMYADRQRQSIAAMSATATTAVNATATLVGESHLRADAFIVAAPALGRPVLAVAPTEGEIATNLQPPKCAEFLLVLSRSPSAAEGLLGDMYELFRRDCAKRGVARAKLFYWGYAMRAVWPLLKRSIGRAAKSAAVISTVKRLFIG